MLLRGPPLSLPDEITAALASLKGCLYPTKSLQEASDAVISVLCLLWTREWMPIVGHRIHDPTMYYLALNSLEATGSFKEAKAITPTIAQLKYDIRLMLLPAMHQHPSGIQAGFNQYSHWLCEEEESTFRSLCAAQHLASSISHGTMNMPLVWWTDRENYQTMKYKGTPLSFCEVIATLHHLETEIQRVWIDQILVGLSLCIKYGDLYDDLSCKTLMYSFYTDPRNTIFADKKRLLSALLSHPTRRAEFVAFEVAGNARLNVQALRAWLASYATFHELLMVYCHLTSGSPSRGTEITAIQLANTELYPLRNLIVFGKHLAYLCTYLKTSATSGHDSLIPHSLGAFASDLIVQDLAIARPFAIMAAKMSHPSVPEIANLFNTYVFVNHMDIFTTSHISSRLSLVSAPHMQIELTISSWRQISTAFRRHLCSRLQELFDLDEEETIGALQMGHTSQTDKRNYGISHDTLAGASEDVLPLYLDASTEWQIVCNVVPGGLALPYISATMSSFQSLVEQRIIKPPALAQKKDILSVLQHVLQRISSVEEKVNQLIEPAGSLSTAVPNPSTQGLDSCEHRPVESPSPNGALPALRQLLGNSQANWTSAQQEKAVLAALGREQDILAVLPTGSGKSMIALIPAFLERNTTTVLVLPLRVLLMDYQRKLLAMGVSFETFDTSDSRLSGQASVVLVSADFVRSTPWKHAISILHHTRPVVRQVIDEAHIPLLSQDFRASLRHMSDIRCNIECQLVLLTASAGTRMVQALVDEFCLGSNALILRAPSNRPELKYIWQLVAQKDLEDIIRIQVQQHLTQPQDRAIIFVPTYSHGQSLSGTFQWPFYHGDASLSNQERLEIHQSWHQGEPSVCVATSGFGTGNDYPHVRLVIHIGAPIEMTNYMQETARAGRDGQPAFCLLLMWPPIPKAAKLSPSDPLDLAGRNHLITAFQAVHHPCIRFTVTSFVDEQGTYCSADQANQLCGSCVIRKTRCVLSSFSLPSL